MRKRIAVCPGSFDPVTYGHRDIIRRASEIFDEVIVLVSVNHSKSPSFSVTERIDMIKAVTDDLDNIEIDSFNGLLADYVKKREAVAIVKGLRAVSDFEYEFQQALANKKLYDGAETVFLTTKPENMFISSSVVKQIAQLGGDITDFVPGKVKDIIVERFSKRPL